MKPYFLDTSVIIDALQGKQQATNLIKGLCGTVSSSYICLAELYEGVERSTNQNSEKQVLEFFSSLDKVYGIGADVAKIFGQIRYTLKKSGNTIEDLDILIGATCLANNLILVTNNLKHFSKITGLEIISPLKQ